MNIPKKRLDFLDWELGVFFHFGIRTFYEGHKDWDMKPMPQDKFNPEELDCEQWIKAIKAAGATYAILVCKHHDGFANWPSKYTDYSVATTPWRDGKGDVVKEFCEACRKHDIKVGLYYSPAQFGSNKMNADEYDDYFINQISELLTGYGKIDYLWFDGCGSEGHEYNTKRITAEIRALQPEILIFNMWDPDTRWIGNESGVASMTDKPEVNSLAFSVQTNVEDALDEDVFLPAECDFRIRKQWFYSDADADTLKSLDELWALYLNSVGHGANMLINIAPDRRGLIMDSDAERFLQLGNKIRSEFAEPVATFEDFKKEGDSFVCEFGKDVSLKYIVIEENLEEGSAVEDYSIGILPTEYGKEKLVFRGFNIGHKAICPLNHLAGRGIALNIREFTKPYSIKSIKVY